MKTTLFLAVFLCVCACAYARVERRTDIRTINAPLDTCPTFLCRSLNQDCNYTSLCTGGTYCNNTSNKCTAHQGLNQPCTNNDDLPCGTDLVCGMNGMCVHDDQPKDASCGIDAECESFLCQSGKCVEKALGESCVRNSNCAGDFVFCKTSTGVCTAGIALNGECRFEDYSGQCAGIYTCASGNDAGASTVTGTCRTPYSKTSGQYCRDDEECGDGLACVNVTGTDNGRCVAVAASSGRMCDDSSVCDMYETCKCNYARGTMTCQNSYTNNYAGTAASSNSLYQCATKNCNPLTESCALSKCKDQLCTYSNNALQKLRSSLDFPMCYIDDIAPIQKCGGSSSSSAASFTAAASSAALVCAVLLALIF